MNYFLELKIYGEEASVYVRPEAVGAVVSRDGEDFDVVVMAYGDAAWQIDKGQFVLNKLINRTSHAGMKVL